MPVKQCTIPRAQRRDEVVVRFTLVEHERQAARARVGELPREDVALHVARAVVVVIVQPRLADRDDPRAVPFAQRVERRRNIVRGVLRLVRVDADRRREAVEPSRVAGSAAIVHVTADRDDGVHAALARSREHRVTVVVERAVVHVGVRVDHGESLGSPCSCSPSATGAVATSSSSP